MSVIVRGKNPRKPHTVRFWVNGKQKERSFETAKLAKDFKIKVDHDVRANIFVDDKAGKANFGDLLEQFIQLEQVTENTRSNHKSVYSKWIKPLLGSRSLTQAANAHDDVEHLVTVSMAHLSFARRHMALYLITSTLDKAVRSGKITSHRIIDIEVINNHVNDHPDFVFPTFAEVSNLADRLGIVIWLMRGCGLRICEALGVEKSDFRKGGKILHLAGQASRDGRTRQPLKHRKLGEYRDVPVPTWLWAKVRDLPEGPLCPGASGQRYASYGNVYAKFVREVPKCGIPRGFHPHSLRHLFASVMLGQGVQITDVAAWLGHKNINETYRTYGHLLPNATDKAIEALDAEYEEWSMAGNTEWSMAA